MFKKKPSTQNNHTGWSRLKLTEDCLLHNHPNFILFNSKAHALLFVSQYVQQQQYKRVLGASELLPELQPVPLKEAGTFKRSDVVVYEPESYILNKHTVLISSLRIAHYHHDDLPAHQIIIARTGSMFANISDAMSHLRGSYRKTLPSGITSLDLTLKPKILLLLINQ